MLRDKDKTLSNKICCFDKLFFETQLLFQHGRALERLSQDLEIVSTYLLNSIGRSDVAITFVVLTKSQSRKFF